VQLAALVAAADALAGVVIAGVDLGEAGDEAGDRAAVGEVDREHAAPAVEGSNRPPGATAATTYKAGRFTAPQLLRTRTQPIDR
jgi:hypothetical protein